VHRIHRQRFGPWGQLARSVPRSDRLRAPTGTLSLQGTFPLSVAKVRGFGLIAGSNAALAWWRTSAPGGRRSWCVLACGDLGDRLLRRAGSRRATPSACCCPLLCGAALVRICWCSIEAEASLDAPSAATVPACLLLELGRKEAGLSCMCPRRSWTWCDAAAIKSFLKPTLILQGRGTEQWPSVRRVMSEL